MKALFSNNRLFITFALYVVIIVVPLGVMFFVGTRALDEKLKQIEDSFKTQLEKVGENLHHDLSIEWESFIRKELFRKYYHYQAVTLTDDEEAKTQPQELNTVRSPLYYTSDNLENLAYQDGGAGNPSRPSVGEIISNSMVGYFSYEPGEDRFTTPYDLSRALPQSPSLEYQRRQQLSGSFHDFLRKDLRPKLLDEMGWDGISFLRPLGILRYLRASRVSKDKELTSKIKVLAQLASNEPFNSQTPQNDPAIDVYYYNFRFTILFWQGDQYIIGFRPVLVNRENLLIQGFLFNSVVLIQEAQSYLEDMQTEFGSVVLENSNPMLGKPLFDPFNTLVIACKTNGDKAYLSNYQDEKRRFYLIMICLTIALLFSMIHMGSLVLGHVDLHRKKNNFISAITHELKAPLTSIMMYAEMLEEGWARGKETTYYQHIRWESERLSRLIRNILDFSGLERGTFKFQRSPLEMGTFVTDTLEALKDWVDKSGLALEVIIKASPLILVDKDSLSQVLYNLCDNAIKYGMSADKPSLTVLVDELEDKAILSVWDNGTGVTKEEADKVFRRFYRIENEMTRESTGTGLGLALVKDLVEGNDGKIEQFRPPEGGFGVRIIFPLIEDEEMLALSNQEFA